MANYFSDDGEYSSGEIDSDTEQRLYAQLHHESNPIYIDFENDEPCNHNANSAPQITLGDNFDKRQIHKELDFSSDHVDSKYCFGKKFKPSENSEPQKLLVIDELNQPAEVKSKFNRKRTRVSSESSNDVVILSDLKTDISINMKQSEYEERHRLSSSDDVIILNEVKGHVSKKRKRSEENQDEDFNVAVLQNSMSDSNWDISFEDRYSHVRRNSRYYGNGMKNVKCHNCNERGHLSKVCPKPRKDPICYLCGQTGHLAPRCRNIVCPICMVQGHFPEMCNSGLNIRQQKCTHCYFQGHMSQYCPDIWRRYHLTTSSGVPLKKIPEEWNSNIQCYNCSSDKHFGYECKKARMNSFICATYPGIISYEHFPDLSLPDRGSYCDQEASNIPKKKKSRLKRIKEYLNFPRRKSKVKNEQNVDDGTSSFLGPVPKKKRKNNKRNKRQRNKLAKNSCPD